MAPTLSPTTRHSFALRSAVLSALLPLLLAVMVTVAAPAGAATTGRATLSTTAYAGDLPSEKSYRVIDEALTGSFSRSLPVLGASGAEGNASASASLTASANASGLSLRGAAVTAAHRPEGRFARGGASSSYQLNGWVVPASGRWEVSLTMRNSGTEDGCGLTTGSVHLGHFPIVDELYYCNDPLADRSVPITLKAGDTLNIKGGLQTESKSGHSTSQASWTITIKPISLDKPTAANAPKPMVAPVITGKPKAGKTLRTTGGTWSNDPTSFAFQWLRKGKKVAGATASTYKVKKADRGKKIAVRVTASNSAGKATSTSRAVKIKKPAKAEGKVKKATSKKKSKKR